MAGGVEFLDHVAEPHIRREPQAHALVVAADLHLLAREVIRHQIELQPRIGGVFGLGEAAVDLTQSGLGLLGDLLVAVHI